MALLRKIMIAAVCGLLSLLIGYGFMTYLVAHPKEKSHESTGTAAGADPDEEVDTDTPVRAIHPKRDPSLTISVQQLLTVEPFFIADLRAQVAGTVRYIQKDIGDPVYKGELLVALDVPQLEQEVQASKAIVEQRRTEYKLALAQVENAQAFADVSARPSISARPRFCRPTPHAIIASCAMTALLPWPVAAVCSRISSTRRIAICARPRRRPREQPRSCESRWPIIVRKSHPSESRKPM